MRITLEFGGGLKYEPIPYFFEIFEQKFRKTKKKHVFEPEKNKKHEKNKKKHEKLPDINEKLQKTRKNIKKLPEINETPVKQCFS